MQVKYFRKRTLGRESEYEDAVVNSISDLFPAKQDPTWVAGSIAIGAGRPDLVVAYCNPQVVALADCSLEDDRILALARECGRMSFGMLVDVFRIRENQLHKRIEALKSGSAIQEKSGNFSLVTPWKNIIRDLVTIEVKVSDWKRAFEQAKRNTIFAHRSYVALPEELCNRIDVMQMAKRLGIGVVSVNDSGAQVLKTAIRTTPKVWVYYYRLALLAAKHLVIPA